MTNYNVTSQSLTETLIIFLLIVSTVCYMPKKSSCNNDDDEIFDVIYQITDDTKYRNPFINEKKVI